MTSTFPFVFQPCLDAANAPRVPYTTCEMIKMTMTEALIVSLSPDFPGGISERKGIPTSTKTSPPTACSSRLWNIIHLQDVYPIIVIPYDSTISPSHLAAKPKALIGGLERDNQIGTTMQDILCYESKLYILCSQFIKHCHCMKLPWLAMPYHRGEVFRELPCVYALLPIFVVTCLLPLMNLS